MYRWENFMITLFIIFGQFTPGLNIGGNNNPPQPANQPVPPPAPNQPNQNNFAPNLNIGPANQPAPQPPISPPPVSSSPAPSSPSSNINWYRLGLHPDGRPIIGHYLNRLP